MSPAFLTPPPFISARSPFRTCTTPLMSTSPKISIGSVPDALSSSLQSHIATILSTKQVVNVAISGGSLPKILAKAINPDLHVDKWRAYLADERCVPLDHDDSNFGAIRKAIPSLQLEPIDPQLKPDECAKDYEAKLTKRIGDGIVFDIVLLGLGPDGHTCSLFPGHDLLKEESLLVAPITDSPKPPPNRVTLTYPVLNRAKVAMFVCTGASKAPVVKDIIENPSSMLPGALVKAEAVEWYFDEAAAAELKK